MTIYKKTSSGQWLEKSAFGWHRAWFVPSEVEEAAELYDATKVSWNGSEARALNPSPVRRECCELQEVKLTPKQAGIVTAVVGGLTLLFGGVAVLAERKSRSRP